VQELGHFLLLKGINMIRIFLQTTLIFTSFLCLSRFFYLIAFFSQVPGDSSFREWFLFLLTGLRFDLMVIGFINAPMVLLAVVFWFSKASSKRKFSQLYYLYLSFALALVTLISVADINYFSIYQNRLSSEHLHEALRFNSNLFFYATSAVLILLAYRTWRFLKKVKYDGAGKSGWLTWSAWLLITALMCRGTLSTLHLDLRNAEVTSSKFLNLLVIPSPYAFDQALRNRR
jgi:hypothetical protein